MISSIWTVEFKLKRDALATVFNMICSLFSPSHLIQTISHKDIQLHLLKDAY